ncbi:MAG: hypothetical protein ACLP51_14085 [Syntrophobacteraceae bacterium]
MAQATLAWAGKANGITGLPMMNWWFGNMAGVERKIRHAGTLV